MAQITKPIALDETLQRVATACEGIKSVLAQQGEAIVLKITANGTSFPLTDVFVSVRNAEDDTELFSDDVPVGVEYTLSETIEDEMHYYIHYEQVSGWHSPRKEVHVAKKGLTRSINHHYEQMHAGAYICTTDHRLVAKEDWGEGMGVPYGIYFSDGTNSFVIAFEDALTNSVWATGGTEYSSYLPSDGSRKRDLTWMGGKDDYDYYIENCNIDNMPPLKAICEQLWSDGKVNPNAYLPSIGELILAYNNISTINALFTLLGKDEWIFGSYWSSSQNTSESRVHSFSIGSVANASRSNKLNTRAFSIY